MAMTRLLIVVNILGCKDSPEIKGLPKEMQEGKFLIKKLQGEESRPAFVLLVGHG